MGNLLQALRELSSTEHEIFPVYATNWQPGYRHATAFDSSTTLNLHAPENKPLQPLAGDIFLGLDPNPGVVCHQAAYYTWLRQNGVQAYFMILDLMSLQMQAHLSAKGFSSGLHQQWLGILAQQDGLIGLSHSATNDLCAWLDQTPPTRKTALHIGGIPLVRAARNFNEIIQDHARFFPNEKNPEALAIALRDWFRLHLQQPRAAAISTTGWQDTAQQLLHTLLHDQWLRDWHASLITLETAAIPIVPKLQPQPKPFNGRLFFDHLPKTAGQAISIFFTDALGTGSVTDNLNGNHTNLLLQYGGKFPVICAHTQFCGEGLDPRYVYLTVLRDPIDRALSWLHYINNNLTDKEEPLLRKPVQRLLESDGRYIHPMLLDSIANPYVMHFSRILSNKLISPADALNKAQEAIYRYDLVGLYECLPDFILDIASLLGIENPKPLPSHNITKERPKLEQTSPELLARLAALNSLDIAFYKQVSAWKLAGQFNKSDHHDRAKNWAKFERNGTSSLPLLPELTHTLHFPALSAQIGSQVGRPDAKGHLTSIGESGFLIYGPYVPLSPGAYSVTLYGTIEPDSDFHGAYVEIAVDQSTEQVRASELMPIWTRSILLHLPFTLTRSCEDLEVRLWVEHINRITFTEMTIQTL